MMRWICLLFCTTALATDYVIPPERLPTTNDPPWLPGVRNGIPVYPIGITATNAPYSLDPTGVTPIDTGLSNAIVAETNGHAIYLPPGVYTLTNSLTIPYTKQIALRGAGRLLTKINVTWTNSGAPFAAILFGNDFTRVSPAPDVTSGYSRGSTSVVVSSAAGISLGNLICLRHKTNDPAVYKGYTEGLGSSQFLTNYQSQTFKVTSISGTTIGFDRPIYWSNYNATFGPYLSVLQHNISSNGIESMTIGFAANNNNDAGLKFSVADNCWVTDSIITNSFQQNVEFEFAYDNTVRHSRIMYHSAYSATSKYAAMFGLGASDNLVEDCVVQGNNLGIVFLLGATGNIAGYCFGNQGFGAGFPGNNILQGGANSHGDLAQFNAVVGCVLPWWQLDSFWGANQYETLWRSWITRLSYYDLTGDINSQGSPGIYIDASNYWHSAVGNIIGHPRDAGTAATNAYQFGYERHDNISNYDSLSLPRYFGHMNFNFADSSTTSSNGFSTTIPDSCYLTAKPSWWGPVVPWPTAQNTNTTITNLTASTVFNPAMADWYNIDITGTGGLLTPTGLAATRVPGSSPF